MANPDGSPALETKLLSDSTGGKAMKKPAMKKPGVPSPYDVEQAIELDFEALLNESKPEVQIDRMTVMSKEEIEALEESVTAAPEKRGAQRCLAEEVTRIVHGDEALDAAVKATKAMFGGDLAGLDDAALLDIFSDVPSSGHRRSELAGDHGDWEVPGGDGNGHS